MPPVQDPATLFSPSYAEARRRFLTAAAARGLAVQTHTHARRGIDGETLATDVVVDGPADAPRLVLITAGVHGIEGYAGSAAMTGLLARAPGAWVPGADDVAVVHVHAVNPHGFSHGRRVNEDNIDLNRNFVDFSAPLPANPDYAALDELLLPAQWPPGDAVEAALAAAAQRLGPRGFQSAVSRGQYTVPSGLFFGGHRPAWSHIIFREVLRQHVAGRRHVAWIDIHTGLGPFGVGERILAINGIQPGDADRAKRWWGAGITDVYAGTSNSVPLQGPIQFTLPDAAPGIRQTNICLEFGTQPQHRMHQALRADHWLHRQTSPVSATLAATIRQDLRDFFYPPDEGWRRAVWQQSCEAVCQALRGLSADDDPYPPKAG